MPLLRFGRKVSDILSKWLFYIAMGGICAMMLLITVDVIGRYLFKRSTLVADELSGYLLVLVVFFSVAETLKRGRHVTVDIVAKRFPPGLRVRTNLAINILGLGAVGVMLWQTILMVGNSYVQGSIWPSILETPIFIPQLLLPVGLLALLLQCIVEIFTPPTAARKSQQH